jgi:hypothetical protein
VIGRKPELSGTGADELANGILHFLRVADPIPGGPIANKPIPSPPSPSPRLRWSEKLWTAANVVRNLLWVSAFLFCVAAVLMSGETEAILIMVLPLAAFAAGAAVIICWQRILRHRQSKQTTLQRPGRCRNI